jgi:hypothetical protein
MTQRSWYAPLWAPRLGRGSHRLSHNEPLVVVSSKSTDVGGHRRTTPSTPTHRPRIAALANVLVARCIAPAARHGRRTQPVPSHQAAAAVHDDHVGENNHTRPRANVLVARRTRASAAVDRRTQPWLHKLPATPHQPDREHGHHQDPVGWGCRRRRDRDGFPSSDTAVANHFRVRRHRRTLADTCGRQS